MVLSNNDKQIRFRKKEELKKIANKIFRDWQWRGWSHLGERTMEDIKNTLDELVDLKANWTESDYAQVLKTLENFQLELYDNLHLLKNDIFRARDSIENLQTTNDPKKLIADQNKAVENMKFLVAHIISTLKLAKGVPSDSAAAIMEVLRFVGHLLIKENKIPKSQATAVCLAMLGVQYEKPEWIYDELSEILIKQMGKESTNKLINKLTIKLKDMRNCL